MTEIIVEEDLTRLLTSIQETQSYVQDFQAEMSALQTHAGDRLSNLISRIESEQQQVAEKFDTSNSKINTAHIAVEALIEQARERAAQLVDTASTQSSEIRRADESNVDHNTRMDTAHEAYTEGQTSMHDLLDESRNTTITRENDVNVDFQTQLMLPTATSLSECNTFQEQQQSTVTDSIGRMNDQDFQSFCNELQSICTDVSETFDQIRDSLDSTRSENENTRRGSISDGETQLNTDIEDSGNTLRDVGGQAREIGTTVGDGVDTVSSLAQTSAVGLTTAIGALNSTYELLEEIKSAW